MFRLLALLLVAAPATAQIVTDRPDRTESPSAVAGLQVETGVLVEYEEDGGAETVDVAGARALVRIGLVPGVEARVALPDYRVLDLGGDEVTGFTDPSVGAKAELGALSGWDLAALAEVSLPVGDDAFSGAASPLVLLIAGRDLGGLSLGTQAETRWDRELDRVDVGGTFVVGIDLTDALGAFAEVAAETTPGDPAVVVQFGTTLLVTPDLQLDAFLGAGASGPTPDVLGGVGVSGRF